MMKGRKEQLIVYILIHNHDVERTSLEDHESLKSQSAVTPRDAAPAILPKQFHRLGTKYSNIRACGGRSRSRHHIDMDQALFLFSSSLFG